MLISSTPFAPFHQITAMPRQCNIIYYTDDDADDHYFFAAALRKIRPGVTLQSFYSCGDVLTNLKDESKDLPDLIFLDHNMPGNSGNQCLIEMKRTARIKHIPVVMYTTSGTPALVASAAEHGAFQFVIKPDELIAISGRLAAVIADFESLEG